MTANACPRDVAWEMTVNRSFGKLIYSKFQVFMSVLPYMLPILALAGLSAGWMAVQLLARHLGTKNHIEHGGSGCGQCGCGEACVLQQEQQEQN